MREEDIRPKKIFDEYLHLAHQDAIDYFENVETVSRNCPACGTKGDFAFKKSSFVYELCSNCHTLFVNPRPVASAFSKYYTESPSSQYWASTFYLSTAESRTEKLWKPKAHNILRLLEDLNASHFNLVDIGGGLGLFAQQIRVSSNKITVVIEPGPNLAAACRQRSIPVVQKFLEDVTTTDLPKGPTAFLSFELFEHLHDPSAFINHVWTLMSPGDLFIFTTLSGTGVDIQLLWENSKSVSPPHHLNFFNPASIDYFLKGFGFDVIDVSTPGKLDLDILFNNKQFVSDRFWNLFLSQSTYEERCAWQDFVSSSGWSSHMMICCRKPN